MFGTQTTDADLFRLCLTLLSEVLESQKLQFHEDRCSEMTLQAEIFSIYLMSGQHGDQCTHSLEHV